MRVARGSASWLSSHRRGLGPRDALKKDSRGLSRGAAGTLIPSAQRVVWAAKQPLGKAALGALFGRGSLVGCHLWGRTESDTTEAT